MSNSLQAGMAVLQSTGRLKAGRGTAGGAGIEGCYCSAGNIGWCVGAGSHAFISKLLGTAALRVQPLPAHGSCRRLLTAAAAQSQPWRLLLANME